MSKQYQLRIDILNMILRFMVIYTIVSMLSLLFANGTDYVWRSLLLFQASIISFIIDKCIKHLWIYVVLHLALMAFYFFLTDDISLRIVFMIYISIWVITQFVLGVNKKVNNTSIILLIFLLIMYCVCRYTYPKEVVLGRFFFYFTLAYGLIYIVNMYFINLIVYLEEHKDIANIPVRQIKASNRIYIVIFVYLSFASMLAFMNFPMDKIFSAIGQVIVKFLRFVLSGLDKKPSAPENDIPQNINMYLPGISKTMPPDQRTDPFWKIVNEIIMGFMVTVFVIMVLIMLFLIFYNIYKMFKQKRQAVDEGEQVEAIAPINSWSSFFEGMNSIRKKIIDKLGKTNNEKIRKLFQKAVQKRTKPEQELKYDTPEQLSRYAVPTDKKLSDEAKQEKEESLTILYEKARYSNDECSKEEVQEVKDLIK